MGSGNGSIYDEILKELEWSTESLIFCACILLFLLIFAYIIPLWLAFKKAGEKGWKSLIPIYNIYILFKICWDSKHFWLYFGLSILTSFFASLTELYPEDSSMYLIFGLATIVFAIMLIVETFKFSFRLAAAYGQGKGFGVILAIFTMFGIIYLGFSKNIQYVGNTTTNLAPVTNAQPEVVPAPEQPVQSEKAEEPTKEEASAEKKATTRKPRSTSTTKKTTSNTKKTKSNTKKTKSTSTVSKTTKK